MTCRDVSTNRIGTRLPITQLGTTLIEVLIAVLAMGIGTLGIDQIGAKSKSGTGTLAECW